MKRANHDVAVQLAILLPHLHTDALLEAVLTARLLDFGSGGRIDFQHSRPLERPIIHRVGNPELVSQRESVPGAGFRSRAWLVAAHVPVCDVLEGSLPE